MLNVIGEAIRSARQRKGWSMDEVTKRTKVSKRVLSQLERGEPCNPTLSTLQRLADLLEIELTIVPSHRLPVAAVPPSEEWRMLLGQAHEVLGQLDEVFSQYRCAASLKLSEADSGQ